MNKKIPVIAIVLVVLLAIGAGILMWKWKDNQNKNNPTKPAVYKNEQYGFKINLPEEIENNYQVYTNPVSYEVGQKDACKNCGLVQFVIPTKDLSSCAFPGECGKHIAFVIWVRDLASWENNHTNKNYACIDSANVVGKTGKYVYTLCPFNIGEDEKKYTPEDVLPLLNKILPIVRNSFSAL